MIHDVPFRINPQQSLLQVSSYLSPDCSRSYHVSTPLTMMLRNPKRTRQPSTGASVGSDDSSVFQVEVPNNVSSGEVFIVSVGSRFVHVRCPPGTHPGQVLNISLRADDDDDDEASTQLQGDSHNARPVPGPTSDYLVTIPQNVHPGENFRVIIQGRDLTITCPSNALPGTSVRITVPPPRPEPGPRPIDRDVVQFEVNVPNNVQPGQQFYLFASGQRVLVTCPMNANPGQRIRFEVPREIIDEPQERRKKNQREIILFEYGKDGWARKIRPDLKFQWVREDNGEVDVSERFDIERSAYVRKLDLSPENVSTLSLVPAIQGVVDSKIKGPDGNTLISYTDIANVRGKSFKEKAAWFEKSCKRLRVPWSEGHVRLTVRRQLLLSDSVNCVMSLTKKDFRKTWRIGFMGEEGVDAGGLTREWYKLVTEQIFDSNWGLWKSNSVNQMNMEINPASDLCNEDHLFIFRALGRIMGKALFDSQLVSCHMAQHLYKHILAWPITFGDLKQVDEEYYRSLTQLADLDKKGENLADILFMTFTTTKEALDCKEETELVEGGADTDVTNENYPEYLEACLKYRMLDQVKPQLMQLLVGFLEVIPEPLLTIFDFQELELLMCGLPTIDIDDWRRNTEYSGTFVDTGGFHEVCEWFWEVVSEFDHEMKARVLQFVTGTSGVPAAGFGVLQGNDGNICEFTIHGVPLGGSCPCPRAHTCFNRIDLPMYTSREDLSEKLELAVTMAGTGFSIE